MPICHYCEQEIELTQESSSLQNNKTGQIINLHYPRCHVRFTTFYKTEKELAEWRKSIRERSEKRLNDERK